MSILIDRASKVMVQGITGKEGARAAHEMIAYGTLVVAGVTPGKGGIKTPDGIPIFDSVREAKQKYPEISASLVVVPAKFAFDAAKDAIEGGIPLVVVLTEHIPVLSVSRLIHLAKKKETRLVGPSSVGIISPGKAKIGNIGSSGLDGTIFKPGHVGVLSKSGGMTSEISRVLTEAGIGQSSAMGIGGDMLIGSDFASLAFEFEQDEQTKAIVIFGEVGGVYELKLAEAIKAGKITKPVVALIAGVFAEHLPIGLTLGHAGAIVSSGNESAQAKIQLLKEVGAHIVHTPEDIPLLLKKVLVPL